MGYNNGDIVRIINEDCTGRKLMRKTASADDADSVAEAFRSVIDKYSLPLKVERVVPVKDPWVKKEKDFSW